MERGESLTQSDDPQGRGVPVCPAFSTRPVCGEDEVFLFRLFSQIRGGELGPLQLPQEAWEQLMRMQFLAHEQHFRNMTNGVDMLILVDGEPAGRMIALRGESELHLADIALLPEQRGRGIGSALIGRLQDEARQRGCALRLRVNPDNPAARLYRRLGFAFADDGLPYRLMEWRPVSTSRS